MPGRKHFQVKGRRPNIGKNGPPNRDFVTKGSANSNRSVTANHNGIDVRVELELAVRFIETAPEGLGNSPGTANGNLKTASGRQKGQHQTQCGSGKIFWTEIDMQRQAGNDAPRRFSLKHPARITCRAG